MASIFQSFPLLKKAAPRLSRQFFTCQASPAARIRPSSRIFDPALRTKPFFRYRRQTTHVPQHVTSPLGQFSHEGLKTVAKKKFFPETSDGAVAYWLLGSAASVFGIVIFGGLTRLTESGLSITEWKPVTGSRPPMNEADWTSEFEKYRASPEFKLLNSRMTLEEFKQIYWMEWTHRLWGRVIGVTFLLPTIYFVARRRVAGHVALKLAGICGLIGFQGVIGWWMVKSGLKDDLFAAGSHPRVSQYRLTAHLGAAFVVYLSMLWTGLSILKENKMLRSPSAALAQMNALKHPRMRAFRILSVLLGGLVFTTAMSGALVAGLDAGLIYNEFPWMGLGLTPPKKELLDEFYSHTPDRSDLWWRNMLENPSLVQLDHRILATTSFTAICLLFAYPRMSSNLKKAIPRDVKVALSGVLHLALIQVTLGISTLIYMVPTWLASAHQAGAIALLTGVLVLGNRLRVSPRTLRLVRQAANVGRERGPALTRAGVGKAGGSLETKVL
ncbi:electron transfer protein 1, mitochondrial precursor [Tothia fuscella]|uniref:Electron transfer protein 1, mitochondrial n=1 Tax=Tothia fuscella TaxID=1048955 RepID=A0A9P4NXI4_9PEZI|nr:electron transfer protein 1, mitochondrial precursor [Tothia fuscella]